MRQIDNITLWTGLRYGQLVGLIIQNVSVETAETVYTSGWQFLLTDVSTTWRCITSLLIFTGRETLVSGSVYARLRRHAQCSSHRTRDHRWLCIQLNFSSCVEQSVNGSAVFWVTGYFSTPPENWTVRAFLQLTPRLSNDSTAVWLTFNFRAAIYWGHNLEVCWL